ncbi:MAG: hypothetical protein ACTSVI_07375 [Promethearchaeota archaeon]
MNGTAHAAYSFLIYLFTSIIFFGAIPSGGNIFLSVVFGLFPDVDGIFWKVKKGKSALENEFQHHLYYPTHWPITYTPLVIITVISWISGCCFSIFFVITMAVYSHLLFDSISCGDGMNWGAPWGRRFINLFSSRTDGYHGNYWLVRYRKTIFFKLENVLAIFSDVILMILIFIIKVNPTWCVLSIFILISLQVTGFLPVDDKYNEEPPGGRYNDYRKLPGYKEKLSRKKREQLQRWKNTHGIS